MRERMVMPQHGSEMRTKPALSLKRTGIVFVGSRGADI
jgi:hypothetical protein